MSHDKAIPILVSRNLSESIQFYRKLGFTTTSETEFQGAYAIAHRGTLELHLALYPEIVPAESYLECYLKVGQVDALFQEFQALNLPTSGIPRLGKLEDKPWGMREFYVVDPSGNLLKIGQPIAPE